MVEKKKKKKIERAYRSRKWNFISLFFSLFKYSLSGIIFKRKDIVVLLRIIIFPFIYFFFFFDRTFPFDFARNSIPSILVRILFSITNKLCFPYHFTRSILICIIKSKFHVQIHTCIYISEMKNWKVRSKSDTLCKSVQERVTMFHSADHRIREIRTVKRTNQRCGACSSDGINLSAIRGKFQGERGSLSK